ncbi:MAG TPA: ESPR-type extended signal peptide-containing protein, partial [Bordetella sp.]|nr:ESPR-type extended signal peptide-containing protein [Bordetella sp.]
MNKTYRTVWCEATRTFVAVAENVRARGKRTSGARMLARAALVVAIAGGLGAAQATVSIPDSTTPADWDGNEILFSDGSGRIVFNQGGTVTGLDDAALNAGSTDAATGRQVHAVDQKAQGALTAVAELDASAVKFNAAKTAIDAENAKITNLQDGTVAAGSKEAVNGGQLHTVDQKAQAAQAAVVNLDANAVKFNAAKTEIDAKNAKITNLQNGTVAAGSKEAVTGGQLHVTNQGVDTINQRLNTLGLGGVADPYTGVKYFRVKSTKSDAVASGNDAVAVGPEASAEGESSIAMGDGASTQATAEAAIAVGREAAAAGKGAVAVGDGAKVESEFVEDAIALGTGATISGDYSTGAMAVGAGAQASAAGAVALGAGASATGDAAVALGAARAQGTNALALGNGAQANALNSIALGEQAGLNTMGTAGNDRTSHIAIGTRAGQNVIGNQTIAMGFEAGSGVDGDQNIAIGSQAGSGVDGDLNVAIGYQANRNADQVDHATAVGSNTYAGRDAVSVGYQATAQSEGAVALGTQARVTSGQGVAIGKNSHSDGAGVALGANSAALASDATGTGYLTGSSFVGGSVVSVGNTATGGTRRIVNVADGSANHDAANIGQLRSAQQSVAQLVGGDVTVNADGQFSKVTLVDTNGDEHQYNTVVDALGAVTSGGISVLPPDAAKYNTDGTLNVAAATQAGEAVNLQQLNESIDANASRYYSVNSIEPGNRDNSNATGSNAMAIGPEASATGDASMAAGYQAYAQSDQALALGHNTNALGANSTVVGNNSFAYGKSGVAMGDEARSQGDNSIVIGTKAQADPKDPNQTVHNSVVIGTEAESTADNGIAVGQSALASDVRGIAQGFDAEASASDATAIGSNAHASGVSATASGTRAIASGANAIASGTDAKGYAESGIAMGRGAQAGKTGLRPDQLADNVDAVAIGTGALADAKNSSALGRSARATAEQALAVGDGTAVSGRQGSALGAGNTVTAEKGLALGAANAINGARSSATGNGNTVNSANAQAVGNDNLVAASSGGVFGNGNSLASGATGSRVIGNNNSVGAADAFVMGNQSTVTVAGGVALGSASASTTGANVAGYVPNGNAGAANNAIAASISTTGAVAVGSNGVRRQITGVAAGSADTDAVNVAQLKATGWNVRTDGDNATHVSTGQGNTVDIGLASGENNLTVARTSSNGNTVIDYALKKNLDLGATGSVKTGDTLVNNAGVAVGPNVALGNTGLVIANGPSVTTGGISAGNKTITNVAAGVNATDAVNVSQLTSK